MDWVNPTAVIAKEPVPIAAQVLESLDARQSIFTETATSYCIGGKFIINILTYVADPDLVQQTKERAELHQQEQPAKRKAQDLVNIGVDEDEGDDDSHDSKRLKENVNEDSKDEEELNSEDSEEEVSRHISICYIQQSNVIGIYEIRESLSCS